MGERQASVVRRKNLGHPDETRRFEHGAGELVRVGSAEVGRAVLRPGWRWSVDVKPLVGTELCLAHHLHVLLSGRFAIQMEDGALHELVPDDVVDVPPGHDAWVLGDEPVILLDISGNVSDFAIPVASARAVVTIFMSDIVASTERAAARGDRIWKQLLGEHDRAVRTELERFRGREIKTTGDGFLAAFESAGAALLCANAVRDRFASTQTPVRIGVHTGEVEVLENDIRGLAVHAAARIMAAAEPSEVLTSAIARALAQEPSLRFIPRGEKNLKGLPEPLELFSVGAATSSRNPQSV